MGADHSFLRPVAVLRRGQLLQREPVGATSSDASGFFVQRAFQDSDGVAPWGPTAANSIGAFQVTSDTTPPETTITNTPTKTVKSFNKRANVLLEFTSSEQGSSFECSLDGGACELCTSPNVEKVKAKREKRTDSFRGQGGGRGRQPDATPASAKFKTKRQKKKRRRKKKKK